MRRAFLRRGWLEISNSNIFDIKWETSDSNVKLSRWIIQH